MEDIRKKKLYNDEFQKFTSDKKILNKVVTKLCLIIKLSMKKENFNKIYKLK